MLATAHRFLAEYDILHFNKRPYTDKYPSINIPTNMSKPAIKNVITHLQNVLTQNDKAVDNMDGTKPEYDEKISI
jgi:hypothetical protein